jgi:DDE superfamily endonuclease
MTKPVPCPPAPGPLEGYAARFDDLFTRVAQRRGFREYLAGLLAPRDRNKTLTALAGAEPVTGAQHPAVQRLQFFLSESRWDPERVNARRLELLAADPATAPHGGGVLVIDDSGDRKDGTKTAHVGRQWLGRYGKTDSGVVTVTTVWAGERVYYPVHAVPCTPARHFAQGKSDPGSGRSCRSGRTWRSGPGRRGSASARRWRTVPAGTRTGSAPGCQRPGCRS